MRFCLTFLFVALCMPYYLLFFLCKTIQLFWFNFLACSCETPGSRSNMCDNDGKCTCNAGYHGDKCSTCTNRFYMSQSGCLGISVMIALMFEFIASSCSFYIVMIHIMLGSVCCCLSGIIMKITAHIISRTPANGYFFVYLFHVIDIYFFTW